MVQIEATSNSEKCWEGVPSPGGQPEKEHRVALLVQVEHYHKNPMTINQSPKFPGLSLSSMCLVFITNI